MFETPEQTRTGKAVYKSYVPFESCGRRVHIGRFRGNLSAENKQPIAFFPEDQLVMPMQTVSASETFFGNLPYVWSNFDEDARFVGDTCVPIGKISEDEVAVMASGQRMGLNFMAKGAFWPHEKIQVPTDVIDFVPIVLPIVSYLKLNLPDNRLWPAVDVVFKISSGHVKKSKSGLDPFLDQAQATGWHTDGDSASCAKMLKASEPVLKRGNRTAPPSNALAFHKQRLIVSSAVPTAFSRDWRFAANETTGTGCLIVRSNGYPDRAVIDPVVFPSGTVVAFTNNNMHTATYAEEDTHRTVMIVSGTINWGNLRKLIAINPDLAEKFSTEPPSNIKVPDCWHQNDIDGRLLNLAYNLPSRNLQNVPQ